MFHIKSYRFNKRKKKKFPHQFMVRINDTKKAKQWLKNNYGDYNIRWMYWDVKVNANVELYFSNEADAMAFKLRWI